MKKATGLPIGRPDSINNKPVASFTGLGSKPVKKATGLSMWLLHRLVHYWQTYRQVGGELQATVALPAPAQHSYKYYLNKSLSRADFHIIFSTVNLDQ